MNVLVTGGAGYLGSVVTEQLLARGDKVRVLDIDPTGVDRLRVGSCTADVRVTTLDKALNGASAASLLEDIDAVIHLAALSNDASAERDPRLTERVNVEQTLRLAELAKARGARFLFSSSCAVYGHTRDEAGEDAELSPLSSYAQSKLRAEQGLLQMSSSAWQPVCLRNGTLFGYSPRMRFDVVVNGFCAATVRRGEIEVFGSGEQWRPYLHVADCAAAFVYFTERSEVLFPVLNIACENLTLNSVAKLFTELSPGVAVRHRQQAHEDRRNYRVSTARTHLSGFRITRSVASGAMELLHLIRTGKVGSG